MKLRWGICGCGTISSDFVNALSLLSAEEHEVVAAADITYDKARDFLRSRNIGHGTAYASYEKLHEDPAVGELIVLNLEDRVSGSKLVFGSLESVESVRTVEIPKLDSCVYADVVYIGLWNHLHKAAAISALRAGKHVLCEKPLGLNSSEVKEMVQAAREAKKFFMEGVWSRMFPVYKKIREEIRNGTIGDPKVITGCFGFLYTECSQRVLHAKYGGGVLMDIGCYLLQLTTWVFGPEKPERISAVGNLFPGRDVDETAAITLQFSGNRVAHLLATGAANVVNGAVIAGSNGSCLQIPDIVSSPLALGTPSGKLEFPLPAGHDKLTFNHWHTAGLSYEADTVRQCIIQGMTECPDIPWNESILRAEIMEECRRQLGVRFPTDNI